MTTERILNLAYNAQLEIWARENDRLKEDPSNHITKFRAEKAWEELKEIENMIKQTA